MTFNKNCLNEVDPSKTCPPGGVTNFHYVPIGKLKKNSLLKPVARIENNLAQMVTRIPSTKQAKEMCIFKNMAAKRVGLSRSPKLCRSSLLKPTVRIQNNLVKAITG